MLEDVNRDKVQSCMSLAREWTCGLRTLRVAAYATAAAVGPQSAWRNLIPMADRWRMRAEYETQLDGQQLAAFAAVIELGSFDAAPDRLYVTPSAISQRI